MLGRPAILAGSKDNEMLIAIQTDRKGAATGQAIEGRRSSTGQQVTRVMIHNSRSQSNPTYLHLHQAVHSNWLPCIH